MFSLNKAFHHAWQLFRESVYLILAVKEEIPVQSMAGRAPVSSAHSSGIHVLNLHKALSNRITESGQIQTELTRDQLTRRK